MAGEQPSSFSFCRVVCNVMQRNPALYWSMLVADVLIFGLPRRLLLLLFSLLWFFPPDFYKLWWIRQRKTKKATSQALSIFTKNLRAYVEVIILSTCSKILWWFPRWFSHVSMSSQRLISFRCPSRSLSRSSFPCWCEDSLKSKELSRASLSHPRSTRSISFLKIRNIFEENSLEVIVVTFSAFVDKLQCVFKQSRAMCVCSEFHPNEWPRTSVIHNFQHNLSLTMKYWSGKFAAGA